MENLENKQTTEVNTEQEQEVSQEIEKETKTFTEEDLNKKIQSAEDRVRTEYSKKLKQMEEELEELRPKEKSQFELDMEARVQALEQKEKEVAKKELELNVTNKLQEQGLPSQLSKYLVGVEDVETEINSLKEIFNNNALNNSFKPQKHNNSKEKISKEDFNKMTLLERQKLYETNQELYLKLSK
ncbi:capsid assembly scaffolding protein Gp46 family protein [Clostridium sporogenes]